MKSSNLKGIDYIEFYVADSYRTANFYKALLGFNIIAYGGPETGLAGKKSYVIEQGAIRFIFSSPLDLYSSIHQHVIDHGDGVKDVAFVSNDIETDFKIAIQNGAHSVLSPFEIEDKGLKIKIATIASFGDTVHTFIQRENTEGWFLPFYRPFESDKCFTDVGLLGIDHIAVALEKGQLNIWKEFYQNAFGLQLTHKEDVYTEYSGMNSLVMSNTTGTIKFPLVEPAQGAKKSQIDSYLDFYGCAGVQHIAFLSSNIIKTAQSLTDNGLQFLDIPTTYYDDISKVISSQYREKLPIIKDLGILIDMNQKGVLMQIFSKPLQNRSTFFIEIIQRDNREGFGSNNIKALFEAIEREQQGLV